MHLKRVDLEGFKSFRRASVPLHPGFTGVTGPNGSGKSNISDAILFVLGTRSNKTIRAGKLLDLIHNGGPGGRRAERCVVTLVFDNTDRLIPIECDEVAVTREVRPTRDGDGANSTYRLNGKAVALSELEALLAHARISADGYNIIQQGDVTRVVTMGSSERRKTLDEIAGITRFDAEIDDAERRRGTVEITLDQLKLILREIGSRMRALQREKERAESYAKLQTELEQTKGKTEARRCQNSKRELENLHAALASYGHALEDLQAQRSRMSDEIKVVSDELGQVETRLAEAGGDEARKIQQDLTRLREERSAAVQMMNYHRDETRGVEDALVEARAELERFQRQLRDVQKELKEATDSKAAWESERGKIDERLNALQKAIANTGSRGQQLQRELAKLRAQHEDALKEQGEARVGEAEARKELEGSRARLSELEDRLETFNLETKDAAFGAKESVTNVKNLDKRREALEKRRFDLKRDRAHLEADIKRLEVELRELRSRQSSAPEGHVPHAVVAILGLRDTGKERGVLGTLAELGTPDADARIALETAAGSLLHAVVVETDEVAQRCIEHLRKHDLGRATFLPLNKLNARKPAGPALMAVRDDEAIGFAVDLVKCKESVKPAFLYAYRDTVVVKTLAAARRLMGGVRMVTLDGDIVDPAGAMTGGSRGRGLATFTGISKDAVSTRIQEVVGALDAAAAQAAAADQELEAAGGELQQIASAFGEAKARAEELERVRAGADQARADLETAVEAARKALDKAEGTHESAGKRLAGVEARLAQFEGEKTALSKQVLQHTDKSLADELEQLRAERDKIQSTLGDVTALLATLTERVAACQAQRDGATGHVAQLEGQRGEHAHTAAADTKRADKLAEKIRVLEETLGAHEAQFQEIQEARDDLRERKHALERKLDNVVRDLEAQQDLSVQTRGRVPLVEAVLAESLAACQSLGVDPGVPVDESQEDLKARLISLEKELRAMEPVNMRALQEYEAEEARRDELEAEVERLEEERQALIELVAALVGKKKAGLMEVFTEVRSRFKEVYARVSGGGTGDIELENEADPFEGGLILKAQPPGKRVLRLEALSGGEKSLAALSFLFAIQQYAPSPFYVLDEVDMFLDGVNCELVARMVKEASHHAQVVMVSLRKVSLVKADHLYGVTIDGHGVTQIVGQVELEEVVTA